ncbi:MAG: hypothetical protein RL011_1892 [Pseudomonadota bacterium]
MLKRLILVLPLLGPVGCGAQERSHLNSRDGSTLVGEVSFSDRATAFEGELPERPRLAFRSEWQRVHSGSLGLVLKLGWSELGIEAEMDETVRTVSASLLDVSKSAATADSKIFRDDRGHFDIREGEPVTGRCEYAMAAQHRVDAEAAVIVAGVKVEQGYEDAKLLEVTVADQFFSISAERTLADYENDCRSGFKNFEARMRQDLAAALKSKVVIDKVGDSRIDALRPALAGESVRFEAEGETWELEPLSQKTAAGALTVTGKLKHMGRFSERSYEFTHEFSVDGVKLNKINLAPRGVDKTDQAALELSIFFAQNVARRAASDGVFSVDTSLLR